MKRKWRLWEFVSGFVILALVCAPGAGKAMAEQLELDNQVATLGSLVTFTLSVNEAPNEVSSFGLFMDYDETVLEYKSYTPGDLSTSLDLFEVNILESKGNKILALAGDAALGEGILEGANGTLCALTFVVMAEKKSPIEIIRQYVDFEGWTTKGGSYDPPPPLDIGPDKVTTKVNESQAFQALGGEAPFTWSILNDDGTEGTLSATTGTQVTYTSPAQAPTGGLSVTIQVEDSYSQAVQANVTVYEDMEILESTEIIESGDILGLTVTGGIGPHTWEVEGPMPVIIDPDTPAFAAPDDGDFAGEYLITVTDVKTGSTATKTVKVPMKFIPYSKNIKGGESFDLVLAGADPDAEVFEVIFLDKNLNVIPEEKTLEYATVDPDPNDDPISFDGDSRATAIVTGAFVEGLKVFKLSGKVRGDDGLTEANGLDLATTGWIRIMPMVKFSGVVQEAPSKSVIQNATILFKLGEVIQAELTSDAEGTFSVDLLSPEVTSADYTVFVSATGYLSFTGTTADWDMENGETIELNPAADEITGTVMESGGGPPIEGAKIESLVDGETIIVYSDANGDYTLSLPVEVGFNIEELNARASKADYNALRKDILVDPNFELGPQNPQFPQQVCEDGGIFKNGIGAVDIPSGALDDCYDLYIGASTPVGDESPFTEHSTELVKVNFSDPKSPNPVDVQMPVKITMPYDIATVEPGDFFNGVVMIYYAETENDLRDGVDVIAVDQSQIIYEDHINGLVCFEVIPHSVFGAGAAAAGGGGITPVAGGGGGGGCFIETAANGWTSSLILLLGVVLCPFVLCSLLARRSVTMVNRER